MRVGFGYDVHPFVSGRPLILGGVRIPYLFGLKGHSDADVLVHAICDALLGAVAEGDIGRHFPDTDPQYKDIESTILLKKVLTRVREKGFRPANVDATIVAQKPKLSDFIPRMVKEVADVLGIEPGRVNVKATTTEGLGFTGREEGIAAYAVALVEEDLSTVVKE
jgi:2-C-methyl-D-erythritol 2,4-cyclodiphosphate synthase